MHRRGKRLLAVLAVCALLGIAAGRFVALQKFPRTVVVAGIALPIDTELGFYHALDQLEKQVLGRPIRLVADEKSWVLHGLDLGVRLDRVSMWEDATRRRTGESLLRYFVRTRLRKPAPESLEIRLSYDSVRLDAYLAKLGAAYWQPPRNARINVSGVIEPEAVGRSIDVPTTRLRLLQAWQQGAPVVVAQVSYVQPGTTQQELQRIGVRYTLARFATYFDVQRSGRVDNIRMAAQLLDGVVIQPEREFSFNETVGPRTLERGFKIAEEIVNQELVPGVGGGVCQVSSTLYNAALLAGLEVVQRQHHSRPLGYIAAGRDATVYYGAIDLRLRNPYSFALVLTAEVADNKISIAVHAPQKLNSSYEILVSDAIAVPPDEQVVTSSSVLPGQTVIVQPGVSGWEVDTWRIQRSLTGQELHRERISHDHYPPQPAIVQVNPGKLRPVQLGPAQMEKQAAPVAKPYLPTSR